MSGPDVLVSCGAPYDPRGGMAASYAAIAALLADRGLRVESRFGPAATGRCGRLARQTEYARVAGTLVRRRPAVAIVSSADSALASALPWRPRVVAMSNGVEHLAREAAERFGYGAGHFRWGHRHVREPLLELAFRRADAAVVLSRRQRDFVVEQWGLDPESVRVLPQSVEDVFHEDRGLPRVPEQVLWIGQWAEFKGIARLVRIVHEAARSRPAARFVLAGVRAPEPTVRAAFDGDVQQQLVVLPEVSRSELRDLVATSHVGLVTSYFEGFGKMILEMMAGALPVVSSRVAAAEDHVAPGVSGYLYDDETGAVDVLLDLLRTPYRADLGRRARLAVRHCRRDEVGDAWAALVREVAAR